MTDSLEGVTALVMGAGKSGREAARFLIGRGARVFLSDDAEALPPEAEELEGLGVELSPGGLEGPLKSYDLAVVSPGISVFDNRIKRLQERGVEVVGEVELASRFIDVPLVAITGTNGKTTVTNMVGEILRACGKTVYVGGNVGTPLVGAAGADVELVVAEISSFQLETVSSFAPHVAVWLNLTGDHLDRHGDLERYAAEKAKLFANQREGDWAIVNRDDPVVWGKVQGAQSAILPFSATRQLGVGAWVEGDEVVVLMPGTDGVRLDARELKLPGTHNLENAMAAVLAGVVMGCEVRQAWQAVCEFEGLAHRIEEFLRWRGVTFLDDSKATNVDAAVRAIGSVDSNLIWLGGGRDKESSFEPLKEVLKERAKLMVLVGEEAERMATALEGVAVMERASDWNGAVKIAVEAAKPGDTVLMSPAAASFDFFSGYVERGKVFKELCIEHTGRVDVERG